jgi:hypothetical protein
MIEIDYSSDLYSGTAIDSAVQVYADYASFELDKTNEAYRVRITATGEFDEHTIADEFSNYALGATIEERQSEARPAPEPVTGER